jgi:predicted RNA-binding Zn-ribbon protein involved in translation (DUF1610 family)
MVGKKTMRLILKQITAARCPNCGKENPTELEYHWTGKLPAKIYCPACRRKINDYEELEQHSYPRENIDA